ncbi:MAG TPA: TRAP transporter small permease [Chloroflexota bacterium]|nr:TRAP transporter small permease [Chloroflexota bacterium]
MGRVVGGLTSIMLAITTVIIFLQVLFRYILSQPLHWTEETARFLFVWVALLGAAVAFKDRSHFTITMLTDTFPPRARLAMQVIVALGTTWLLGILIREGLFVAGLNHIQVSPAIGIPMSVPYMAIPVGAGLGILFLWMDLFIHWRNPRAGNLPEEATPAGHGREQGAG